MKQSTMDKLANKPQTFQVILRVTTDGLNRLTEPALGKWLKDLLAGQAFGTVAVASVVEDTKRS